MPAYRQEPLSILVVASEAVPFAKTGGLADVTAALSDALVSLGHEVTLVIPRYRGVVPDLGTPRREPLRVGSRWLEVGMVRRDLDSGTRVVFIDCPPLFDREGLYAGDEGDHPDNAVRFAVLARAAFRVAVELPRPPDVLHAHDWQAGLVPVYAQARYAGHPRLGTLRTVFTIHNLGYQGTFPASTMEDVDLPSRLFDLDGLEYWGQMSFLKGALNCADTVTTVSPTYAREILTPEHGHGMDGVIRARRDRLHGILNGIDVETWDPSRDPFLPRPYSLSDLSGKRDAKRQLLEELGATATPERLDRPLVGMISRLVYQKGFDLVAEVVDELPGLGATYVVLGTGEPVYEEMWRAAARRHPESFLVRIGYDERLAHLVEAGADIFLMPSRYEPCGLNQMYSMRYGTVPVVRATGGLADAVTPFTEPGVAATGFAFTECTGAALLRTLERAVTTVADKAAWRALQEEGMTRDFSWNASALQYVQLYRALSKEASPITDGG